MGPYHVYNFSCGAGTDKWAYEGQVSSKPPGTINDPTGAIDSYSAISADDGTFEIYETSGAPGSYAAHRFNFTIAEPVSKITKINVTWNGIGEHENTGAVQGATLYIWNFTAPAGYEELGSNSDTNEVYLTGEKTEASNYIDSSGTMAVLVVQNSARASGKDSLIKTDYVRVAVVATP